METTPAQRQSCQERPRANGLGIAGFVMSLITLFLGWIPFFGWISWAVSLVLSFIGMFIKPRGMAVAGFVLSIVGLIFILFLYGLLALAVAEL